MNALNGQASVHTVQHLLGHTPTTRHRRHLWRGPRRTRPREAKRHGDIVAAALAADIWCG